MTTVHDDHARRMSIRRHATAAWKAPEAAPGGHIHFNVHHQVYQHFDQAGRFHAVAPELIEMNEAQFERWLRATLSARAAIAGPAGSAVLAGPVTTHHDRIARACCAVGVLGPRRQQIATAVLADLDAAGLVILPAVANQRLRHEACKGAPVNAGTFAAMWDRVVAYARTLNTESSHGR